MEAIDKLTYNIARASLATEQSQLLFLRSWWSKYYNRPLKDPLLQEYTLEELYYEYRDKVEREEAAQEASEEATDNIEQKKIDEAMAWAEEEERREQESLTQGKPDTEILSEDDKTWMEEQLKQAKTIYGDDFGEDIVEDFDG